MIVFVSSKGGDLVSYCVYLFISEICIANVYWLHRTEKILVGPYNYLVYRASFARIYHDIKTVDNFMFTPERYTYNVVLYVDLLLEKRSWTISIYCDLKTELK